MPDDKEDPKKKYKNLSREGEKTLEQRAGEITDIKSHDDRLEHAKHFIRGYHDSHVIKAQDRAPIIALMHGGEKTEAMQEIYNGIHKAHDEKKGELEYNTVLEWMKRFANVIMPAMKLGAEGEAEGNYDNMVMYLEKFDEIQKQSGMGGDTVASVMDAISEGNGAKAAADIIEAVNFVRKNNEVSKIVTTLSRGSKHRIQASLKIAKDVNQYLKGQGKKYEVTPEILGENFVNVMQNYSRGEYDKIVAYDKSRKKRIGK